jgi:methionine-rich copper-binding protein CopC
VRRAVACWLWLLFGLGLGVVPVQAQVRCLSSFPAPGATYSVAPDRVILWMSEPVDPQLSSFLVASREGRRFEGPVRVSADGRRVEVALRPLEAGVYLVVYRAASLVGGHVSTGFFAFGVREPVPNPEASWRVLAPRWAGPVLGGLLLASSALRLAGSPEGLVGAWIALGAAAVLLRIGRRPEGQDRVRTR